MEEKIDVPYVIEDIKTPKKKVTRPRKKVETVAPPKLERVYKGTKEIDHDLFELDVKDVVKNHGFTKEQPILRTVPHKHFFHSFDSNGRKQFYATPACGHTHSCEMYEENGALKLKVGTAVEKFKGSYKQYKDEREYDTGKKVINIKPHTHTFTYIVSERISIRKRHKTAQETMALMTDINSVASSVY